MDLAAAIPISSEGTSMVVKEGLKCSVMGRLSKPVMDSSPGTSIPLELASNNAPIARTSLPHIIAVGG